MQNYSSNNTNRCVKHARNSIRKTKKKRTELNTITKAADTILKIEPEFPNEKLVLNIEIPPSVNLMYFYKRFGNRTVPTLKPYAKKWMIAQQQIAKKAIISQTWHKEPKGVWINADFDFYFPDRRTRDTHNCYKITMDTFEGIVYENDYYIKVRTNNVELDKSNPRVTITFTKEYL